MEQFEDMAVQALNFDKEDEENKLLLQASTKKVTTE